MQTRRYNNGRKDRFDRPGRREDRQDDRRETPTEAEEDECRLEGRNAVQEALRSGRTIDKVFVASGEVDHGLQRLAQQAKEAGAVVVSVDGRDFDNDPVKAVAFQRQLEQAAYRAGGGGYLAPAETVGSFLAGRGKLELGAVQPSYPRGVTPCDLGSLLPGELAADLRDGITAFGRKLRAYQAPDAVLTGLETRTSSPVRLLRGDNFQCTGLTGLYPCGEGAGYAGGIMTAAVDGVRCAAALMQQYAPDKA